MAIYSLRPLTPQQRHRRWRGLVTGLCILVPAIFAATVLWLKIHHEPITGGILVSPLFVGILLLVFVGFILVSSEQAHDGRHRHVWEIAPQGIRFYSDVTPVWGQATSCFIPLSQIACFEIAPGGGIAIRGKLGHGTIAVPKTLDGIERFRRELLACGVREAHPSPFVWYVRRAAGWIGLSLLTASAFWYMLEGSIPWLVLASVFILALLIAWNSWTGHRLREGQWLRSQFLYLALMTVFLIVGGSRAWHLRHPANSTRTIPTSSPQH